MAAMQRERRERIVRVRAERGGGGGGEEEERAVS